MSDDISARRSASGNGGEVVFGRSRQRRRAGLTAIAVALIAAGVVAAVAGQRSDEAAGGSGTTTPPATVAPLPAATLGEVISAAPNAPDITIPPRTTVAGEPEDTEDDGLNPLGGDSPEDRLMPDVVCMNLQEAQDEIQDHGVFFSKSKDASGDDRRQLWDRNWVVVSQEPAPGEPIGEREAVLSVLKTDEATSCD